MLPEWLDTARPRPWVRLIQIPPETPASGAGKQMSSGLSLRPVTPGSLKVLMALEGLAILLLGSWLYVEYNYSLTFRDLIDDLVFARITMWTLAIGLSVGLAGSAAALRAWRNVRKMRYRIETLERDLTESSKRTSEKPSIRPVIATPNQAVEGPLATVEPHSTSLAIIPGQAKDS